MTARTYNGKSKGKSNGKNKGKSNGKNKGKSNGKSNGNCKRWLGEGYIPTHRDETAMDGAPDLFVMV
jgi:hypothetical protein